MVQDLHWEDSWAILLVICVGASPPRHPPRARGHPNSHPNSLARDKLLPLHHSIACNDQSSTSRFLIHCCTGRKALTPRARATLNNKGDLRLRRSPYVIYLQFLISRHP